MDYVAKVHDLAEASKSIDTLQSVLDKDIERNSVRKGGSHSRNLLRVKRGLDMVRVLFEQIMVTEVLVSCAHKIVFLPGLVLTIGRCYRYGMVNVYFQLNTQFAISARDFVFLKDETDIRHIFAKCLCPESLVDHWGNSLKGPASKAYAQVFAPHHGWAIRKAVAAGMYALPTKAQLLKKLNEDESSAIIQMQSYVAASAPVIMYVDKLFLSRELGIDW
ncbi:hypothetical protein NC652_015216 [Populus alba x Populus x berolinensis]|nr:hypothetical protein NC652_015216 [Populus alba x Populus x berolinensis]